MITENTITETKAYQRCSLFEKTFILKRRNVEIIDHTITVYENTAYLNENIGGKNLNIVKEILKLNK